MHRLGITLAATLFVFSVACGGGDDGPTGATSHVGNYSLVSVDGDPVPSTLVQGPNYLLEVTQGSGSINGDNTYSTSLTFRENDHGTVTTVTLPSNGTYTRTGNAFIFTDSDDGSRATGVFSGNRMTITDEDDFVYVFQK
jgi:hypothetical protein